MINSPWPGQQAYPRQSAFLGLGLFNGSLQPTASEPAAARCWVLLRASAASLDMVRGDMSSRSSLSTRGLPCPPPRRQRYWIRRLRRLPGPSSSSRAGTISSLCSASPQRKSHRRKAMRLRLACAGNHLPPSRLHRKVSPGGHDKRCACFTCRCISGDSLTRARVWGHRA